jgi:hypothetical protein
LGDYFNIVRCIKIIFFYSKAVELFSFIRGVVNLQGCATQLTGGDECNNKQEASTTMIIIQSPKVPSSENILFHRLVNTM